MTGSAPGDDSAGPCLDTPGGCTDEHEICRIRRLGEKPRPADPDAFALRLRRRIVARRGARPAAARVDARDARAARRRDASRSLPRPVGGDPDLRAAVLQRTLRQHSRGRRLDRRRLLLRARRQLSPRLEPGAGLLRRQLLSDGAVAGGRHGRRDGSGLHLHARPCELPELRLVRPVQVPRPRTGHPGEPQADARPRRGRLAAPARRLSDRRAGAGEVPALPVAALRLAPGAPGPGAGRRDPRVGGRSLGVPRGRFEMRQGAGRTFVRYRNLRLSRRPQRTP